MTRYLFSIVFLTALVAGTAADAACYADYKAKRDDPLRLHYGVVAVKGSNCTPSPAITADVTKRLAAAGWTLLQVESVFDETALDSKKADAGDYFLRF